MTASTFAVGPPKHELKLVWSSVRGEQFICTCGWEAEVDTRMSMLLLRRPFPFTQAVWIGVEAGKAHAQHLLKAQAAEENVPHRSACPGCGHPECDAVGEDGT